MSADPVVGVGQFLVATPLIADPNFSLTVVLILDVSDGALGLVLNRPLEVGVDQVLGPWGDLTTAPDRLFQGGPVGTDGAMALAVVRPGVDLPVGMRAVIDSGEPGESHPDSDRSDLRRLGMVDLDTPTELLAGALDRLRVFAGYSGWAPGQLEGEIERGDWFVVPGEVDDIFSADPDRLWRRVLRRQPGDLSYHSTWTTDTGAN